MMIIPLWDPAAAAAEIERTAARGAKSIAFSENPTKLGLPVDPHRLLGPGLPGLPTRPGFVLSMHVGSSSNLIRTSDDMPTLAFMAYSAAANQAGTLLDWLFSGKFETFPGLKIALSEGSIGWIPYFLERAEQVVDKQRFWASRFDINMNADPRARRGEGRGQLRPRHRHPPALPRPRVRDLHRGPGRAPAARHHRRGQRHARVRLPALGLDLARLDQPGPQVAGPPARRGAAQDRRRQRRPGLQLHAGRPGDDPWRATGSRT